MSLTLTVTPQRPDLTITVEKTAIQVTQKVLTQVISPEGKQGRQGDNGGISEEQAVDIFDNQDFGDLSELFRSS